MFQGESEIAHGSKTDQDDRSDFDRSTDLSRSQARDEEHRSTDDEQFIVVIEDETEGHLNSSGRHLRTHACPRSELKEYESFEASGVIVCTPENEIEAQRISNNYKFGLKKWKSHVTSRPITTRSEIVQDLYSDINKVKPSRILTFRPFNIIYLILFGWWLSLIYIMVAGVMFLTVVGKDYGHFCLRMAKYFIWPFGKFVHQVHEMPLTSVAMRRAGETQPLLPNGLASSGLSSQSVSPDSSITSSVKPPSFWKRPQTYVWLILGIPILWPVHAAVWLLSWFFVITIPIAKVNSKVITKLLFMPPSEVHFEDQSVLTLNPQKQYSEIVMYTHQAVNIYYYKLTVDGVNVILVNLLLFVVLSIVLGYADENNVVTGSVTKCILGVLAIIPLTYYVGMGITSISAQSSFAVGAVLNATFGSMVELILFVIMLKKGNDSSQECYQELVRSSLTGAILVSILFIPGISMVIGGIKFRSQNFNHKSASVSASLLFVSIAGVFSPTIFSMLYGHMTCQDCEPQSNLIPLLPSNQTAVNNTRKPGFDCRTCVSSVFGPNGDRSLYTSKVEPLVYCCAVVLPIAYVVGLIFTMKTHTSEVYDEFETQLKEELHSGSSHTLVPLSGISVAHPLVLSGLYLPQLPAKFRAHHHGSPQWSRIKSIIILLLCATAIALCGDLISNNIEPLLENSGMSEYFIGVTMLSLVAELPEVVNGIQFALQNNVNLGIEIGSSTAIQVCLVQVPMLVLIDIIYPMGFHLIFAEVHFWAVIFSVIVINYIFQDGKSDYFQGFIVVFIYILLMVMYVFTNPPDNATCVSKDTPPGNSTPPTSHLLKLGEL